MTSYCMLAWIITCILFVFGALSGYAGILFKKNRLTKSDHINGRSDTDNSPCPSRKSETSWD